MVNKRIINSSMGPAIKQSVATFNKEHSLPQETMLQKVVEVNG
jgi:hypothetical protein